MAFDAIKDIIEVSECGWEGRGEREEVRRRAILFIPSGGGGKKR